MKDKIASGHPRFGGGTMSKFFLKSKTIQGLILMVLGGALRASGVEVSNESLGVAQTEILSLYPEIIEFIGLVWAGYGRFKASGGVTFKVKG